MRTARPAGGQPPYSLHTAILLLMSSCSPCAVLARSPPATYRPVEYLCKAAPAAGATLVFEPSGRLHAFCVAMPAPSALHASATATTALLRLQAVCMELTHSPNAQLRYGYAPRSASGFQSVLHDSHTAHGTGSEGPCVPPPRRPSARFARIPGTAAVTPFHYLFRRMQAPVPPPRWGRTWPAFTSTPWPHPRVLRQHRSDAYYSPYYTAVQPLNITTPASARVPDYCPARQLDLQGPACQPSRPPALPVRSIETAGPMASPSSSQALKAVGQRAGCGLAKRKHEQTPRKESPA